MACRPHRLQNALYPVFWGLERANSCVIELDSRRWAKLFTQTTKMHIRTLIILVFSAAALVPEGKITEISG